MGEMVSGGTWDGGDGYGGKGTGKWRVVGCVDVGDWGMASGDGKMGMMGHGGRGDGGMVGRGGREKLGWWDVGMWRRWVV